MENPLRVQGAKKGLFVSVNLYGRDDPSSLYELRPTGYIWNLFYFFVDPGEKFL